MPSPIVPSDLCDAVVHPSDQLCEKFKSLVRLAIKMCSFWTWAWTSDGHPTPAHKQEFASIGLPIGVPVPWLIGSSVPAGFVIQDGRAVSRTDYAELFALWGTTFGAGDGSTTFNVADLSGRVFMGANATYPVGSTGGEAAHTLTGPETGPHTHTVNTPDRTDGGTLWSHFEPGGENYAAHTHDPIAPNLLGTTQTTPIAEEDPAAGQSHNNLQPYYAGYWICRAKTI